MNNTLINTIIKIKNSSRVYKKHLDIQTNPFIEQVLKGLYHEGYIQSYRKLDLNQIRIFLKSENFTPGLSYIKMISRPSNPISMRYNSILSFSEKVGTVFISTSNGVLTSFDCKKNRQGGNVLFICK